MSYQFKIAKTKLKRKRSNHFKLPMKTTLEFPDKIRSVSLFLLPQKIFM